MTNQNDPNKQPHPQDPGKREGQKGERQFGAPNEKPRGGQEQGGGGQAGQQQPGQPPRNPNERQQG